MKLQATQVVTVAPEDSLTREQLMASENLNSITGNDLYGILRLAAESASNTTEFVNEVNQLLEQRFVQTPYYFVMDFNGVLWTPASMPNSTSWGGQAGTLPGPVGQSNQVQVFVWWS